MSWKEISHDAFARFSLLRRATNGDCDWCGNSHNGRVFEYATQSDGYGARVNPIPGQFCTKQCMQAYCG